MKDFPAFPRPAAIANGMIASQDQEGMTLRDYFAAHALQGMLSAGCTMPPETVAMVAYTTADAMMEARKP